MRKKGLSVHIREVMGSSPTHTLNISIRRTYGASREPEASTLFFIELDYAIEGYRLAKRRDPRDRAAAPRDSQPAQAGAPRHDPVGP